MFKSYLFLLACIALILSCAGPTSNKLVAQNATPSPTPTEQELRLKTQEQMLKGENHHDGAITLIFIGNMESVPALLEVLKENPPGPGGGNICTAEHALEALKKITGVNPGNTHKAWKSWWNKYQNDKRKLGQRSNTQSQ